jgi:ribonuclease Z
MDNGHLILFDAGEDVQRRMEAANLRFNVPTVICISHMHGDHVVGLLGLLFNFQMGGRTNPLTVIGPSGIAAFIIMNFPLIGLRTSYPLEIREICVPEDFQPKDSLLQPSFYRIYDMLHLPQETPPEIPIEDGLLYSTRDYSITATWVWHSVPTMGFRIIEAPRDGRFNPDLAKSLKIPEGHLWGKMQRGQTVKLPDGRIIDPFKEGIVGEKRKGRIIGYSGDTGLCPGVNAIAKNTDAFICEATFDEELATLAVEKAHLTAKMAAQVALDNSARQLFLTHFSSRYNDLTNLKKQAAEIYPQTILAEDLLAFDIKLPEN